MSRFPRGAFKILKAQGRGLSFISPAVSPAVMTVDRQPVRKYVLSRQSTDFIKHRSRTRSFRLVRRAHAF